MKRVIIVCLAVLFVVGLVYLTKFLFWGTKQDILFVSMQKHTPKDIDYKGGLNSFEWFIVTGDAQRDNLEREGYVLPKIDFSKNYLIISRYRISKLYRKALNSPCTGIPEGRVVFDKENSKEDEYYLYLSPVIMLSQGVG